MTALKRIIDHMGLSDEDRSVSLDNLDEREDFDGFNYGEEAREAPGAPEPINIGTNNRHGFCVPSTRLYFTVPHPMPPHKSVSDHVAEMRDAIGCVVLPCARVSADEAELYLAEYGEGYAGKQIIENGCMPPISIETDRTLLEVMVDAEYFDETWPGGEFAEVSRLVSAVKHHVDAGAEFFYGSDFYISPVVSMDDERLSRLTHSWRQENKHQEAA